MAARKGERQELNDALAAVCELSLKELKARWAELFRAPPPSRLSRDFLVRGIAFKLQQNALGSLKLAACQQLMQSLNDDGASRATLPPSSVKPGTRLLREYEGHVHEVIILEKGVQYAGKTWSSLSAVAREITGTRWSGPLFFGLKERQRHV